MLDELTRAVLSRDEIAKYLAMTEKMVVDTYGHHSPDWLRGAANAIGKPFRRISA